MLYYTRNGETIVIPSEVCDRAELDLAHTQMQLHRHCRLDHCAWKWVAYTTLVHHGRIVPPLTTLRTRARRRDLSLPTTANPPDPQLFREILDGLTRLARELDNPDETP
ncbi:hypothetical protein [Nocardia macrotermitis]|uniref:Uncharacterized protein n=1 Tax=Nocardia macrotermitis TaxID=2585198 RepID=A0A7K0D0V6_9NOCA|nr:hypothetical protein [Nocardia macrotermitis]MQY18574.1 hypothetical protein [Nocardia macrotermitis]